ADDSPFTSPCSCPHLCSLVLLPMRRPPQSSTLFPYTTLFRSLNRALEKPGGLNGTGGLELSVTNARHIEAQAPANLSSIIDLKRSEEHTSELQSRFDLVCRLLLEKKKITSAQERAETTTRLSI